MTNYDTRVQALKVYLPGVLVSARKPTLPNAYVNCLTMHFDTVRRVNKYVYASRRDRIGKGGKPELACRGYDQERAMHEERKANKPSGWITPINVGDVIHYSQENR